MISNLLGGLPSIEIHYFLVQLAIILLSTKTLGILMRKMGLPQVLGFILAGVLFGPTIWQYILGGIDPKFFFPISETAQLDTFAKIGVILILFTAGLETDLKEMKSLGVLAFMVALGGVIVPLVLGFLIGIIFFGTENLLTSAFIGVILTATSVGITVETLREMGKLKGKIGTIILSSAIIDDIIGIVVLSIVINLNSGGQAGSGISDAITGGNPYIGILWMLAFFVIAVGVGIGLSKIFHHFEITKPNVHRVPILSLVVCFAYAFIAEAIFGVADITGAYIAGVVLSTNHRTAEYADKKIAVNSYMIFAPVFFFNIGRQIIFSNISLTLIGFFICFTICGILGKIIGCGGVAYLSKYNKRDSLKIGVGMIARGEVALIVAERGIQDGLVPPEFITIAVLFVFITSVLAPILLKLLYKKELNAPLGDNLA